MRKRPRRRWLLSIAGALCLLMLGLLVTRSLFPLDYVDSLREACATQDLDPAVVAALIRWESRFEADALSPKGAIGLMQIMPDTGAWIAENLGMAVLHPDDLRDAEINLSLGTWYLRSLIDRFGTLNLALAAYNAGPSRVEAWQRDSASPYPETEAYIRRIRLSIPLYRILLVMPEFYRALPSVRP